MDYRQLAAERIGKSGCYFDSIVKKAEKIKGITLDLMSIYFSCLKRGWIEDNCFVNNPAAILELLTGESWECRKEPVTYIPKQGEEVILRYEWATTMETYAHFVCGTHDKQIEYDPYGNSKVVQNGKLAGLRVFARKL